jgi:hypothetical protein
MLKTALIIGAALLCTSSAADTCESEFDRGSSAFERGRSELQRADAEYGKMTDAIQKANQDKREICNHAYRSELAYLHAFEQYNSSSARYGYAANECKGENKSAAKRARSHAQEMQDYAGEMRSTMRQWQHENC